MCRSIRLSSAPPLSSARFNLRLMATLKRTDAEGYGYLHAPVLTLHHFPDRARRRRLRHGLVCTFAQLPAGAQSLARICRRLSRATRRGKAPTSRWFVQACCAIVPDQLESLNTSKQLVTSGCKDTSKLHRPYRAQVQNSALVTRSCKEGVAAHQCVLPRSVQARGCAGCWQCCCGTQRRCSAAVLRGIRRGQLRIRRRRA